MKPQGGTLPQIAKPQLVLEIVQEQISESRAAQFQRAGVQPPWD